MPDSIFSHHSVALVTFHHDGTALEYSCCRGSRKVNVIAADFERELEAAGRSFHNFSPRRSPSNRASHSASSVGR
jgi:hypothetical protein